MYSKVANITALRLFSPYYGLQLLKVIEREDKRLWVQRIDKNKKPIDGCIPFLVYEHDIMPLDEIGYYRLANFFPYGIEEDID